MTDQSEALQSALGAQDWTEALKLSTSLGIPSSYVHKHHFLSANDPSTLAQITDDSAWVAAAALSAPSYDHDTTKQALLIDTGLKSTREWVEQAEGLGALLENEDKWKGKEREDMVEKLKAVVQKDGKLKEVCEARWMMLELAEKWDTYREVYRITAALPSTSEAPGKDEDTLDLSDDPWDDPDDEEAENAAWGSFDALPPDSTHLPTDAIPFSIFRDASPRSLALGFASALKLPSLTILMSHYRLDSFELVNAMPLHANPSDPIYGADLINLLPRPSTVASTQNISSRSASLLASVLDYDKPLELEEPVSHSPEELSEWYKARVAAIDICIGDINIAISFVQHGASLSVPGLEPIAEDLSLLSKLLYETGDAVTPPDWSLDVWRSQTPEAVVAAYLAGSTPTSLPRDIRRLVLPYLGVLEARLERSGSSDLSSSTASYEILRHWTLHHASLDLSLFASLIKASSPSLRLSDRILKDDADLARLALAALYASADREEWETMSAVFECMPAFPDAVVPGEEFSGVEFLRRALVDCGGGKGSAVGLYEGLSGLDAGKLGALLDVLDDDLATGEVLARWSVPTPLKDLDGKIAGNKVEQSKLATRMARQEGGRTVESEDEWMALMEAMEGLAEKGKAFELLGKEEVVKLFFGGLLSSGKFRLAKSLFSPSTGRRPLDSAAQEQLVIATSREYYDNAESGNQNVGEMKLALECLSAGPQTPAIRAERDFIEATSRLASFRLHSQPGVLMSPIQIRLTPDKLTLVSRLLSSSEDAYRHPDMVLDLVSKLGLRGDRLAEVRTLALIADAALRAGDNPRATESCERMISVVETLRRSRVPSAIEEAKASAEVAWRTCAELGGGDSGTKELRMKLLGHALILCPPTEISSLLETWRTVEASDASTRPKLSLSTGLNGSRAIPASLRGIERSHSPLTVVGELAGSATSSLSGETAARAARGLGRAAALFPFGRPRSATPQGMQRSTTLEPQSPTGSDNPTSPTEKSTDRITAALSNRFASGVGWLIGADD